MAQGKQMNIETRLQMLLGGASLIGLGPTDPETTADLCHPRKMPPYPFPRPCYVTASGFPSPHRSIFEYASEITGANFF